MSPNLENANEDTLKEILREAETYLQAQLTAALAADQRAMNFSSVLGAGATAIATAGGVLFFSNDQRVALSGLCFAVALGLLASMLLSNLAARPISFEFPGNDPGEWQNDLASGYSLKKSLAQQAQHYSAMIQSNKMNMKRNNQLMRSSIWTAWGSLVLGLLLSGAMLFF